MTTDLFLEFARPVHLISGAIVLVTGLWQLAARKGGRFHRIMGRCYVLAMVILFASSFPVSILHDNLFLTVIGLFSLYLSVTGFRLAQQKTHSFQNKPDRIFAAFFFLAALVTVVYAILLFLSGFRTAGIVLGVFGGIFITSSWRDARRARLIFPAKPAREFSWLKSHIIRMVASYLAAVTAFLVNVQPFGSHLLNWLLPTAIGSWLIHRLVQKYAPDDTKPKVVST